MDVPVSRELETGYGGAAAIAPRNDIAERGLAHARQSLNAAYRVFVMRHWTLMVGPST